MMRSIAFLEESIRRGWQVPIRLEPTPRYGRSLNSPLSHVVRDGHAYLRNRHPDPTFYIPAGLHEHVEMELWSALEFAFYFGATWKCGNQTHRAEFRDTAGDQKCPRCFGLPTPVGRQRPVRSPAVHALPDGSGGCLAHDLLPVRRCRVDAAWEWGSIPVCTRHLTALREDWFSARPRGGAR